MAIQQDIWKMGSTPQKLTLSLLGMDRIDIGAILLGD